MNDNQCMAWHRYFETIQQLADYLYRSQGWLREFADIGHHYADASNALYHAYTEGKEKQK